MNSEGKVTRESIRAVGGYLDLDNYPIINSKAFYKLTPSEKIVVLHILKQHNYYMQSRNKEDIMVTVYTVQSLTNKKGVVLRSLQRVFIGQAYCL